MAAYTNWTELFAFVILVLAALSGIPETSGYTHRHPILHQRSFPQEKTKTTDSIPSLSKQKRKKILKVSKNLFNKLKREQDQMEHEAEIEVGLQTQPKQNNLDPIYTEEVKEKDITPSAPSHNTTSNASPNQADPKKKSITKPYYDCPVKPWSQNDNGENGKAIIKADPFDCGCYYYCNWGIHYVECCPWLTLWNNEILACDWYWNVQC